MRRPPRRAGIDLVPHWAASLALVAAAAGGLGGCHDPLTQVVVVVESDLGASLAAVRIEIGPSGAPSGMRTVDAAVPFSFGVRPRDDRAETPVRVALSALDATGGELTRTEALVPFVRGETRRVVLHLERACAAVACPDRTCRAGICVDPAIPIAQLEPVAPGDELDDLPPFPRADAGLDDAGPDDAGPDDAGVDASVDAGPICTPACTPDEVCTPEGCRCGDGSSCGESALCEAGSCVPWPRSCDGVGRAQGCDLVTVGGGTFTMGDERAFAEGGTGAFPVQPDITVSGLTIDAYEVSVARFRTFWLAGHPAPSAPVPYPGGRTVRGGDVTEPTPSSSNAECNWSSEPGAREEHPLNCVTWSTALAFCAWDGARLPTEAEWEWVARGRAATGLVSGRDYPWGNEVPTGELGGSCSRAQAFGCPGEDGATTRRVGSFAPSAGVFDLAGNVIELTADHYDFYGVGTGMCWRELPRTNPLCQLASGDRAIRGGSYGSPLARGLMSASRGTTDEGAYAGIGLRCVR